MNTHSMLDIVLNNILRVVTPLQEDWEIRLAIINDLRSIVESVENLRASGWTYCGAIVEPFGSFVSNLFTRWGDLDISIELSNGLHISPAGRKLKQTLLKDVLDALSMKGGVSNLQFISNARVPILKFKSNRQGVSCDISINNLPGQMKSMILLWISKIDDRLRQMVLLVKEWAKAHKINNSKAGTFNSYSLSLLVIFYFQTCVPAILPPLKDIYPGNMVEALRGVRADAENLIAETCDANINRFISNNARSINRKSVAELFVEFIAKFVRMDSLVSELGICPYTGQWERIQNNKSWLPKTYAILIEDPFEQSQNTARSVSTGQLKKITEAFLRTHNLLTSTNQNQDSLLANLAPQHVVRCITRSPIRNYGGGYFRPTQPQVFHPTQLRAFHPTQPQVFRPTQSQVFCPTQSQVFPPTQSQVQRAIRPRQQSQRHFQNSGQGTSSNNSSSSGHILGHKGTNSNSSSSNGHILGHKGTNSNSSSSNGHIPVRKGTGSNSSSSNGHILGHKGTNSNSSSSNGHILVRKGTGSNSSSSNGHILVHKGRSSNSSSSKGRTQVHRGQQIWRPRS